MVEIWVKQWYVVPDFRSPPPRLSHAFGIYSPLSMEFTDRVVVVSHQFRRRFYIYGIWVCVDGIIPSPLPYR